MAPSLRVSGVPYASSQQPQQPVAPTRLPDAAKTEAVFKARGKSSMGAADSREAPLPKSVFTNRTIKVLSVAAMVVGGTLVLGGLTVALTVSAPLLIVAAVIAMVAGVALATAGGKGYGHASSQRALSPGHLSHETRIPVRSPQRAVLQQDQARWKKRLTNEISEKTENGHVGLFERDGRSGGMRSLVLRKIGLLTCQYPQTEDGSKISAYYRTTYDAKTQKTELTKLEPSAVLGYNQDVQDTFLKGIPDESMRQALQLMCTQGYVGFVTDSLLERGIQVFEIVKSNNEISIDADSKGVFVQTWLEFTDSPPTIMGTEMVRSTTTKTKVSAHFVFNEKTQRVELHSFEQETVDDLPSSEGGKILYGDDAQATQQRGKYYHKLGLSPKESITSEAPSRLSSPDSSMDISISSSPMDVDGVFMQYSPEQRADGDDSSSERRSEGDDSILFDGFGLCNRPQKDGRLIVAFPSRQAPAAC